MKKRKKILALFIASLFCGTAIANDLNSDFANQNVVINKVKVDEDYEPNGITFSADADSKENDCLCFVMAILFLMCQVKQKHP